jgi:hypothetical protein
MGEYLAQVISVLSPDPVIGYINCTILQSTSHLDRLMIE